MRKTMEIYTVPSIADAYPGIVRMNQRNRDLAIAAVNKRKALAAKMADCYIAKLDTSKPRPTATSIQRLENECEALPKLYGRFPADAQDGLDRHQAETSLAITREVVFWAERRETLRTMLKRAILKKGGDWYADWLKAADTPPNGLISDFWDERHEEFVAWTSEVAERQPDEAEITPTEKARRDALSQWDRETTDGYNELIGKGRKFWETRREELRLMVKWLETESLDPTGSDVSAWLRATLPDWLAAKAQTFPDKIVVFAREGDFVGALPAFPGDRITVTSHPDYDYLCSIERASGLDFDRKTGEAVPA
jgi:hypothetical protein